MAEIIAQVWIDIANECKKDKVATIVLIFGIDHSAHGDHAINIIEILSHGEIVHDSADASANEVFRARRDPFAGLERGRILVVVRPQEVIGLIHVATILKFFRHYIARVVEIVFRIHALPAMKNRYMVFHDHAV